MEKLHAENEGRSRQKKIDALTAEKTLNYQPLPRPQTCTVDAPPQSIQKIGRKLIVFDPIKTMTAEAADYYVQVQPNKDYEIISGAQVFG